MLLDTHVLLWWLADDPALGQEARAAIADGGTEVFASAASAWEISIKRALGRLEAPADLGAALRASRFRELPITVEHALRAGALPRHHPDPFARMLVAQAQAEDLTLMTSDAHIPSYAVQVFSP